jgi:hypothetical protein
MNPLAASKREFIKAEGLTKEAGSIEMERDNDNLAKEASSC